MEIQERELVVNHAIKNKLLQTVIVDNQKYQNVITKGDLLYLIMEKNLATDSTAAYELLQKICDQELEEIKIGYFAISNECINRNTPQPPQPKSITKNTSRNARNSAPLPKQTSKNLNQTQEKRQSTRILSNSDIEKRNERTKPLISGILLKKGKFFWNSRLFVIKGRKLYYFDVKDPHKPRNVIRIPTALFNYSDCSEWQGPFGFNFYADDMYHVVCVPTEEDQEKWITALTSAGAHFSEVSFDEFCTLNLFHLIYFYYFSILIV